MYKGALNARYCTWSDRTAVAVLDRTLTSVTLERSEATEAVELRSLRLTFSASSAGVSLSPNDKPLLSHVALKAALSGTEEAFAVRACLVGRELLWVTRRFLLPGRAGAEVDIRATSALADFFFRAFRNESRCSTYSVSCWSMRST